MGTLVCTFNEVLGKNVSRRRQLERPLIHQILQGRQDLLADLIEPHLNALGRAVRTRMRGDADADDVIQQALYKAFTKLAQFRFEADFRTWLIQIALNEVSQNWRTRFGSRFVELDRAIPGMGFKDPKESPFASYARNQAAAYLKVALGKLPEIYRVVMQMRDFEELSVTEVAGALGLTIGAVKTRHHRARLMLARFVREHVRDFQG